MSMVYKGAFGGVLEVRFDGDYTIFASYTPAPSYEIEVDVISPIKSSYDMQFGMAFTEYAVGSADLFFFETPGWIICQRVPIGKFALPSTAVGQEKVATIVPVRGGCPLVVKGTKVMRVDPFLDDLDASSTFYFKRSAFGEHTMMSMKETPLHGISGLFTGVFERAVALDGDNVVLCATISPGTVSTKLNIDAFSVSGGGLSAMIAGHRTLRWDYKARVKLMGITTNPGENAVVFFSLDGRIQKTEVNWKQKCTDFISALNHRFDQNISTRILAHLIGV